MSHLSTNLVRQRSPLSHMRALLKPNDPTVGSQRLRDWCKMRLEAVRGVTSTDTSGPTVILQDQTSTRVFNELLAIQGWFPSTLRAEELGSDPTDLAHLSYYNTHRLNWSDSLLVQFTMKGPTSLAVTQSDPNLSGPHSHRWGRSALDTAQNAALFMLKCWPLASSEVITVLWAHGCYTDYAKFQNTDQCTSLVDSVKHLQACGLFDEGRNRWILVLQAKFYYAISRGSADAMTVALPGQWTHLLTVRFYTVGACQTVAFFESLCRRKLSQAAVFLLRSIWTLGHDIFEAASDCANGEDDNLVLVLTKAFGYTFIDIVRLYEEVLRAVLPHAALFELLSGTWACCIGMQRYGFSEHALSEMDSYTLPNQAKPLVDVSQFLVKMGYATDFNDVLDEWSGCNPNYRNEVTVNDYANIAHREVLATVRNIEGRLRHIVSHFGLSQFTENSLQVVQAYRYSNNFL
ncbi:hypothetical protein PT974_12598 [Cladobotryum mycophilum]|uniref:Uncharacterized protein n=1 Tax=Cladobotryum mycophilum TaxID=491253 RepID=A0ABR0S9C7_9HYPO